MIPQDFITEWAKQVPWSQAGQVELDLIISRALVEMFERDSIRDSLAFRGGTALYKLFLLPPARFSEDIDLVQRRPGPIGPILDAIREALDPWLGVPRRTLKEGRIVLLYRMVSEGAPPLPLRLKIEINSREHFSELGYREQGFTVQARWFSGGASVTTFHLDEMMGTKLRALYQRNKGRDLFDLQAARLRAGISPERLVRCFLRYVSEGGHRISRAEFEENLTRKASDPTFPGDVSPLLAPHVTWDFEDAVRYVRDELLTRLPGRPWKGSGEG